MDEFLYWISIGLVPLASAAIGAALLLMLDSNASEKNMQAGAKNLIMFGVIVIVAALGLVGRPVIEPLWLQVSS